MGDQEQVTISFYAPAELRESLDNWAAQERRSRSNLLCTLLEPLVQQRESQVVVAPREQIQKTLVQSLKPEG